MVVVRESPRAHHSPDKNGVQWPPKSPFQAFLSSPGGRKKWQDYQKLAEERSPSPSPARKSVRSSQKLQELAGMDDDDQEEEDEETLQLKLQEIQAKLKLKRLQAKEKREGGSSGRESWQESVHSASPRKSNISPTRLYKAAVEVPVSPVRKIREPQEQLSPARKRLGLTSVPRAEDVSLKRARDGSQIKRSESRQTLQHAQRDELPKVKSFSERLAQSKNEAEEKQAKKDRLDKIRSSGFNHTEANTPSRREAEVKPNGRISRLAEDASTTRPSSAGRLQGSVPEKSTPISRSASARAPREKEPKAHARTLFNPGAYGQDSGTGHDEGGSDSSLEIEEGDDQAGFDPFSKIHLKKRNIEHSVIGREMEGKEVYSVRRLLKEVKAPHYDPPDCESDYVVFAVLASKSQPFSHAESHKTAEQAKEDYQTPRNKFMVLHLTDLEWEIDCFLFGTAFNQFWKLTPGTLLAILNPAILPPKGNQNNGRFSLKLGSSEDAVMEIGIARDLGYCSAVKKDGQPCGEWINKRKTEACEFHISLQIEKNRKGRMEVNSMFRGTGNPNDKIKSRLAKDNRPKKTGGSYHREYGQLYTVNSAMGGKSAASLLDADDTDALHNMTQEEASRKRIANAQKERDLAKKLGEMGRGVGAEYMRTKHQHTASSTTISSTTSSTRRDASAAEEARNALFSKPSAAELGLLGKKASDAHLSPAKDRKKHFGLGAMSIPNGGNTASKTSEPLGWGGARKPGLLQPKESRVGSPERGQMKLDATSASRPRSQDSSLRSQGSSSPVKKKARFNLERGIREPGRDSLPGVGNVKATVEDDDDDLDIIV